MNSHWAFFLDGPPESMRDLEGITPFHGHMVVLRGEAHCLVTKCIPTGATPKDAIAFVEKAIGILNGLARLDNPLHKAVSFSGKVEHHHGNGTVDHVIQPKSAKLHIRTFPATVTCGPKRPTLIEIRAKVAAQDPLVAEVLQLLGEQVQDWSGLRLILEKIVLDVEPKQKDGRNLKLLVGRGLTDKADMESFLSTAHDDRFAGSGALHAVSPKKHRKPSSTMSISTARHFVNRTLDEWISRKFKV